MGKRKIHFLVRVWLGCLLTVGCHPQPSRLEKALQYSGANRSELQKVLDHYSRHPGDSLKRQAAVFLIENMPGHYTFGGDYMQEYKRRVDAIGDYPQTLKRLLYTLPFQDSQFQDELQLEEDIKHIRADFLIHHIEGAFHQWTTYPWLRNISFETFCEYLLPYRMENEPLDYWRDSTRFYQKFLDEFYRNTTLGIPSIFQLRHRVYASYYNEWKNLIPENRLQHIDLDCILSSRLSLNALRTVGIPSAIDFIPNYANHNGRHYWTMPVDDQTRSYSCYQSRTYMTGKIYRRTYARQPALHPRNEEYIPPFFRDPFNKDVTDLYLQTADITLSIPGGIRATHVYLAIFNESEWKPLAASTVKRGKAFFPKMGKNVLYLPVYFQGQEMVPFSEPLILGNDGKIQKIQARKDQFQAMDLIRKYPYPYNFYYWTSQLSGSCIEVSDNAGFHPADTIFQNLPQPDYGYIHVPIDPHVKKRYWRLRSRSDWYNYLAELEFLDDQGRVIRGQAIGTDTTHFQLLEDKDPLTLLQFRGWIGMDFGRPVSLSEIRLLGRGDGNGIYPGQQYELFYYDFPAGWISLGSQTASDYKLSYKRVPAEGLYWLRNLTTGKEERIFTWESGKAHFW